MNIKTTLTLVACAGIITACAATPQASTSPTPSNTATQSQSPSPEATPSETPTSEPTSSESAWTLDPALGIPTYVNGEVLDVIDFDEDEAISILEDAGFVVEVDYVESDYEDDGYVLDQTPAAGEVVDPGSTVTIEVGSVE
jgi:serine/threonine-protein kinase